MTEKPSTTTVLDRDATWAAIDAHRARLVDLLDGLADDEWRRQSLCDAWTVRDVAAHLTLQQIGPGAALAMAARHRGDLDRAIREEARRKAALPTGELVAGIRATIGTRRHNFGVTIREALIDILVHGQDIAIPVGRTLEMAPDAAATAATRMWTTRWPRPFPAALAMRGLRVEATDTGWSAGNGPEVRGPIGAIVLVAAGRLVALPRLSGPGVPALAGRLSVPAPA